MTFVILTFNYIPFIESLYRANPDLRDMPYAEQLETIHVASFGTADFYSHGLRAQGHEATDIIWNNEILQLTWCREYAPDLVERFSTRQDTTAWLMEVMLRQIEAVHPDALFQIPVYDFPPEIMEQLKSLTRLYIGQCAYPLREDRSLHPFDLMLSSLPNYVERFRSMGLKADLLPLGFDPRIEERLPRMDRDHDVVFIGGFCEQHMPRTLFLEQVIQGLGPDVSFECIGYTDRDGLAPDSPIRERLKEPLWGLDMFATLKRAKIVLNAHAPWAEGYANNMRQYEATGMEACLLTHHAPNIDDFFIPGREIATYDSVHSCVNALHGLLSDTAGRQELAHNGHQRTITDHTYADRAAQLAGMVEKRLTMRDRT